MRRQKEKLDRQKWGYRFLKQHELDHITDKRTLDKQVGFSLKDRCIAISKEFPQIHINPTLLRKVYFKYGIKKKRFRYYKSDKNKDEETIARELRRMRRELAKARKDGYRIIYIDECMFTRATLPKTEWTLPKNNMNVDLDMLKEPTLALLHGISKEKGNEHFHVFEKSVDTVKFKQYIDELSAAN